MTKKRIPTAN